MNRRQEIAAWVFGALIALALLVTDNGIWALVVLAGLTILSLRDRHKKKQKSRNLQASSNSDKPAQTVSEPTLKNLTPHLLATLMLQRLAQGAAPFRMWRDAEVEIPSGTDDVIATACEFYQLRIFLDLLKRRFGPGIAKLVESSFSSIVDPLRSTNLFSKVNAAISYARALGPAKDGPENDQLRLDMQVADQYLNIFSESDEQKEKVRWPLAQCLTYARLSAENAFTGLISQIDFDPLSVVMVARETEYKGATNRWSDKPGCFERHLQRKEDNFLFPLSERQPTDEAIREACAKDEADLQRLEKDVTAVLQSTERLGDQETIASRILLDFLQGELDPLMRRAAEIGEPARRFFQTLEELRDSILKDVEDSLAGGKSEIGALIGGLKETLQGQFNLFLAQTWRSDTPIKAEEVNLALLCESTDTIRDVVEVLQHSTPETVGILYQGSVASVQDAAEQGFELPGAEEKLALLKACSEGAKSTATA